VLVKEVWWLFWIILIMFELFKQMASTVADQGFDIRGVRVDFVNGMGGGE